MPVMLLWLGCESVHDKISVAGSVSLPSVRVMPLGDSITESSVGLPTYRFYLWQRARAGGYSIDFVGSQRGTVNGPPLNTDFDQDHEGHSGWRADQIRDQIDKWAAATSPQVILLHLGHNDLCQGQSVTSTVEDVASIIDTLRTVNPTVTILVAQVIGSSLPCHAQIPALNAQLPAMVAVKTTPASPLRLVDQYSGFDPITMTTDGVHPNAIGESQMADRWYAQLAPMLDRLRAQPLP